MAFHVTQCPSCESTFNTSARLLESAAGKVRCGACLTVFEAEQNFIDQQPLEDSDDGSVFVGNNPEDFFDPSVFLTRSALSEPDEPEIELESEFESEPASMSGPDQETGLFDDTSLSPGDTGETSSDPAAAAASPDGFNEAIESGVSEEPVADEVDEFDFPDSKPEHPDIVLAQFDQITEDTSTDISTGAKKEDTQSDGSQDADQPPAYEELATDDQESGEQVEPEQSATPVEKTIIERPGQLVEPGEAARRAEEQTTGAVSSETSPLSPPAEPMGVSLSVSFTVDHSVPRETVKEQEREQEKEQEKEQQATQLPDQITQQADHGIAQTPRDVTQIETGAENPDEKPIPIPDDATGETGSETFTVASDESDATAEVENEIEAGSDTFIEAAAAPADTREIVADNLEQQFNEAIEEEDFQSSIEQGLDASSLETDLALPAEDEIDTESEPDLVLEDPEETETVDSEVAADSDIDQSEATAEESIEEIRARALRTELEDEDALEVIPEENLAALGKFSTPVELVAGKRRAWGQQITLSLLILLMIGVLGAQYLWRNQQPLSQVANIRPLYEFLCERLECEISLYSDIEAIRSDNLAVRSHPEAANGLMVTVAFRNAAPFPQPFPILVLGFNSVDNSVVALREFSPGEYLDPGLRDVELMPVMAPVQVNLEIVDPGPGAVNYTLAFRRP